MVNMVGIFVLHLAADGVPVNQWVRSSDVNAYNGRGDVQLTHDPSKAWRFADAVAAMAYWQRPSTVRPFRPDGKPNRPLTAFSVSVQPLPD
jgi:hypothetical protein